MRRPPPPLSSLQFVYGGIRYNITSLTTPPIEHHSYAAHIRFPPFVSLFPQSDVGVLKLLSGVHSIHLPQRQTAIDPTVRSGDRRSKLKSRDRPPRTPKEQKREKATYVSPPYYFFQATISPSPFLYAIANTICFLWE
jgi:hypothetical protein